jgi:DNA-binding NtrC family response regulator
VTRERLLLVDDEESFRKLVARELGRAGYVVEAAGSVAEAREAIARESFHLVLLDLRLPDGNGIDLLSDIKSSLPATQVVILTAYGTVAEAIVAMKEGAYDFLTDSPSGTSRCSAIWSGSSPATASSARRAGSRNCTPSWRASRARTPPF